MKCPKCQADNRDIAKFCIECGEKLEIKCPQCNSPMPPLAKFCDECGYNLKKPKEAPAIDFSKPQSYTPKFLADKILTNRSAIEGERKLVTVLFADVANYTSMSEKLDPEEVHQVMDGCFKILMDEIHRYEGTINQFTGDGVMALFGAPVAHEDHAQRACHAALAIQSALNVYGKGIKRDHGQDFKMRMGLNSGQVIVGAIGDDLRMDYTAVGDTTNLAARMESMAEPGTTFVSINTQRLARDFFEFKSLGKVEVKGKEDPQEVFELIKTGDVETRIGASVAKGLTRFVGRKKEMATLEEAFEKAQSGAGQVVGIVGEAGVGKSRLLIELRDMMPTGQSTYLEGRCLHYGGSMPYLPLLDVLRFYFDIKEGEREFVILKNMREKVFELDENLKIDLPPLQELLSLKVEDENYLKLEPQQKKEKTFEALRNLLVRVSQNKPLILAVEDLHWIDKTSEEFLSYLIDWLANASILLLLLYRPEYTHSWGSKSYYSKIGVGQLSSLTSAELVQSILEGAEVVPELNDLILNRSGGIPLFMEEFTHNLLENGIIQKRDRRYVLSRKGTEIDIPDTIEGIIAARIDRLEENLKRTMQVASVIGREFAFRILQTTTGMKEELKSHLINLQGLEFIYEKRLFPELEYIFKHIMTQEVAYNSLLFRRRKEIHESIGQAIEQVYAERLEEFYEMLAYHYLKAEILDKAAHYLKLSGIKATSIHAPIEAFYHFTEALTVLKRLPESDENKRGQIEVSLLMYPAMMFLGQPEGSLEILEHGAKLSEQLGDQKSLVTFYSNLAVHYHQKGDPLPGIEYGEKACHLAENMHDTQLVAATSLDLIYVYLNLGEYTKLVSICTHIIDLLEKNKMETDFCERPMAIYPVSCAYCGVGLVGLGDFEKGIILIEKGLKVAEMIQDQGTLALVELMCGLAYLFRGQGKPAFDHSQIALKCADEVQQTVISMFAKCQLGLSYGLMGEYESARKHLEAGIAIQKKIQVEVSLSDNLGMLSWVYYEMGNYEAASSSIEKALSLAQKHHEKASEGFSRILLGRIIAKSDPSQHNRAEKSILEGIDILESLKVKSSYPIGYLFLGEIYADTGQKDKALENLIKAESMFKEMGMNYYLLKAKEALARL